MKRRPPKSDNPAPYKIQVIGAESTPIRDLYHSFLKLTWGEALGIIFAGFVSLNLIFALLYLTVGGVANAHRGSLFDAFSFSVETLSTIGYGEMYPASHAAGVIVWCEAFVGLLLTAVVTGLVFSKFTLSGARIVFSHEALIASMDGVPTLMFRLGNARGNIVADATVKVVLLRTEHTREGKMLYRMHDLPLVRERTPALNRSWTVMHPIVPGSMLYGYDANRIIEEEVELGVTITGIDDTSLQPVHARRTYYPHQILWGRQYVDVLTERPDGTIVLDITRFHQHEASPLPEPAPPPVT